MGIGIIFWVLGCTVVVPPRQSDVVVPRETHVTCGNCGRDFVRVAKKTEEHTEGCQWHLDCAHCNKTNHVWVGAKSLLQPGHLVEAPVNQLPPEPSRRRRAVLVGINYTGTSDALRGSHNDVRTMYDILTKNHFNFHRDEVKILMDDHTEKYTPPTKRNIMAALRWMVHDSKPGDC